MFMTFKIRSFSDIWFPEFGDFIVLHSNFYEIESHRLPHYIL